MATITFNISCTLQIKTRSSSLCKFTERSSYGSLRIVQPPLTSLRAAAASGPNPPGPNPPLQNDLTYVLKLAGGSIVGAALIKYGSATFPDITRPNLALALLIIATPVLVAVLLLFIGTRKE